MKIADLLAHRAGEVMFYGQMWHVSGKLGDYTATWNGQSVRAETIEALKIGVRFLNASAQEAPKTQP